MSKFKEAVQKDISNVFLNVDEFADNHTIDGKSMPALIDENEAGEREIKYVGYGSGTYKRHLLVYVSEANFGPLPTVGRTITLDGKTYRIHDAVSEDGIHAITLEAITSGGSNRR